VFYNHPGFIEAQADRVRDALGQIPAERREIVPVLFTAHSIPLKMAENCRYVAQLEETCRLVAESTGLPRWRLVYQSRSGPPPQPWLEPDLCQCLRAMHAEGGLAELLVVPVGFLSDHMEVLFDIDVEAQELARELGVRLIRAATAGNHPRFVRMIRELIQERLEPGHPREAIGKDGPSHDVCPADCCRYTVRRPGAA
jgi:ferrochelatase